MIFSANLTNVTITEYKENEVKTPKKKTSSPTNKPKVVQKGWFLEFINSKFNRSFTTYDKVKLRQRLKLFHREDIEKAITNAYKDPHHIETGFKYLTPEYFTRNDATIDKWLNTKTPKGKGNDLMGDMSNPRS